MPAPELKLPKLGTLIPKMGTRRKAAKNTAPRGKSRALRNGSPELRTSLIDALFTSTQQRLLTLLFGQPDRTFFTREIIELVQSGTGAVQRELLRLTGAGLVLTTNQGNQKHYQANQAAPVFDELRGIVLKTVGLAEPIEAALAGLKEVIQLALAYGSVAKHAGTASSDVDLLIVSDGLLLEKAYAALASAEHAIFRKINVTLLTPEEFERRRTDGSPFVSKVLAGKHLVLIGEPDGLSSTRKPGTHSTA
jgi:predicted nucleotidyltransferase